MSHIAVITGDLIGSTRVPDPAAFRGRLRALLAIVRETFAARTQQFRGDGFQVAVDAGGNIFRVALVLRTGLISHSPGKDARWDARIAIATGPGQLTDTDQNSDAYVNSGRLLDDMDNETLCVFAADEFMQLATATATAFADDALNGLTPTEAEALYYYLLEQSSHQRIADRLGKRRPTITMTLQRARYQLLDRYIGDMDKLLRLHHG